MKFWGARGRRWLRIGGLRQVLLSVFEAKWVPSPKKAPEKRDANVSSWKSSGEYYNVKT